MTHLTTDAIAWTAFALAMGCGLVVLGWALGLNDRDQRNACELSKAKTQLAQTDYLLSQSRQSCAGTDANAAQVSAGMAWVYVRYARDPALFQLQDEARTAKRGLWADSSPVPPWDFRKASRSR